MYSELGEKFEEKLLNVTSKCVNSTIKIPEYSYTASDSLEIFLPEGRSLVQDYVTSNTYSVLVRMNADDLHHQNVPALKKGL